MGKLTAKLECSALIGPFGSLPHIKAHGQSRGFPIFSTHGTENTDMLPNLVISSGRREVFPLN